MSLHKLLFVMFRELARLRMYRLCAMLLHITSRPLPRPLSADRGSKNKTRVLALTRDGFDQDIAQCFGNENSFEVLRAPRSVFKGMAAAILSPQLDNNRYITGDPEIEATKVDYYKFLEKFWEHFQFIRPVDAVMSGNFCYYAEREFASVLEKEGTPFVVLHKENLKSAGRIEFFKSVYVDRRGHFTGRKILVYNTIERDLQIDSGVVDDRQVTVTGMSRLDGVHQWRAEHAGRPAPNGKENRRKVLFFSFWTKTGLPRLQRKPAAGIARNLEDVPKKWDGLEWEQLCRDSHQAMIELARKRPDLDVIIKSKGRRREMDVMYRMLGGKDYGFPPNLNILIGGDPFQSLVESDVIVGFNTTGLLEGIAAGKPVIVPLFAEALDPAMQDFLIDLGDAAEYASSPGHLIEMICHHIDAPRQLVPEQLSPGALKSLRKWVGNDDGHASARVLEAVQREIGRPAA
ncbi:MAG: hypothetical protein IIB62_01225 [Proteobacteria bacterium]|nr:hypothetical protein [Pseudomonadota bacterium]